ncbi:3-isopropylmalate dehydratase [Halobacteriales archaeon QS_8_69_73]|nr:MAG: 3-isopropylmalate dehydratase [Halobacteriales archaeon QS_8_69_73]
MARVQVHADDVELDSPVLVEGLPGTGLVGKITADNLVKQFDMSLYGSLYCEGLPDVAVYHGERSDVLPPVRLYADETRDLLVLQSDIPVSPSGAPAFADCITDWFEDNDVFPLYLSGLPEDKNGSPELYGIAAGEATTALDAAGIVPPRENGLVTGPTGALLARADRAGLDAVGLVVQTDPQFPDPEAARVVLEGGVGPIADIEVDTDALVEQAGEIQSAREELARQLQDAGDESTQAQTIRGFQ